MVSYDTQVSLYSIFIVSVFSGIINQNEIVEVKCCYKVASSGKNLEECVKKKKYHI